MLELFFWLCALVIIYTYLGYGLVLYLLVRLKRRKITKVSPSIKVEDLPEITLMVAAYNEVNYVDLKMENSLSLNYPAEKLHFIWVTDGSDDGTPELLQQKYPGVKVLHQAERQGKIAAINRAVSYVTTPYIVFSDANTQLSIDSILRIAALFKDPTVGCVSGEKRIITEDKAAAASAGEGIYWKYESTLKRWDAELYSAVGAAGELFAVRTELFNPVETDTLLDDFVISLRIAMKGYRIEYDPEAYAAEWASESIKEELKRKIRIAAGGIQSIIRLYPLLNIFKYGILSFQYISHRVLRWTITPLLLPIVLLVNILLANDSYFYTILLLLQGVFYLCGLIGQQLEHRKLKIKLFFVPYYFLFMNYAVFLGFFRYLQNKQSVKWERAKRMDHNPT